MVVLGTTDDGLLVEVVFVAVDGRFVIIVGFFVMGRMDGRLLVVGRSVVVTIVGRLVGDEVVVFVIHLCPLQTPSPP